MLEFNITHMIKDKENMINLSGSRMEHGDNAGRITWNNSLDYSANHPLLTSWGQQAEAKRYFKSMGCSDMDEQSPEEIQALVIQYIAGSIRDMEHYDTYEEYLEAGKNGQCNSDIFRADDGQWYITLSE